MIATLQPLCPVFLARVFRVCVLAITLAILAIPAAAQSTAAPVDLAPRPLGTPRPTQGAQASPVSSPNVGSLASAWQSASPLVRTTASLAAVLSIIMGLALLVRRMGKPGSPFAAALGASRSPAGIIEVLGRYPLSRGHALVLVKIERRILLLSHPVARLRSPVGQMTLLAQFDDPEDVASILLKAQDAEGATTADRFRELLSKFDSAHDDGVNEAQPLAHLRRASSSVEGDRVELWDDSPDALRLADAEPTMRSRSIGGRR